MDNYKKAGVDIEAGYEVVKLITPLLASTMSTMQTNLYPPLSGLFDFSQNNCNEPLLVAGTDGVGTKIKVAVELNRYEGIGIDLVAMCVNDVLTKGASPLFFLDYFASGKTKPEVIQKVVTGIAEGCRQAGCALLGGETAEMPGMYTGNDFDVAGFAVGVVDKQNLINGNNIEDGDAVIGLSSSGLHSNGFSLVRLIIERNNLKLDSIYSSLHRDKTLGDIVLTPTKIYVNSILPLIKNFNIKGLSHITGGSFRENLSRIIPEGLTALINIGAWEIPPIFSFLEKTGNISSNEMYDVFNMGIGMVVVLPKAQAEEALEYLHTNGENAFLIGEIRQSKCKKDKVVLK